MCLGPEAIDTEPALKAAGSPQNTKAVDRSGADAPGQGARSPWNTSSPDRDPGGAAFHSGARSCLLAVKLKRHTMYGVERIEWDAESAHHIRTRSARYDSALDIEPAWTTEVVADPDRLVDEPDPRSAHANSVRIVGYSPTAQTVVTVVALRDRAGVLHGASAWKTTGAPLRQYSEGRSDD